MKKNIHNNIYTGILGFLVVCTFFIPVSYSSTTQKAGSAETTFTEGFTLTKTYAAPVVTPGAQSPGDVPASAKGVPANDTGFWAGIGNAIFNTLGQVVLNIASIITYIGGGILDLAITHLVLGMGDLFNGDNFGTAIDDLWGFIRDISNLAFIFGFIFAGIKMILDPESSSAKHTISKIIIGALLINFSLFFVKAIIDFSNFTAVQIFNAMADSSGSIAGSFADQLGIITIFQVKDAGFLATITALTTSSPSTWFYVMAALFLVITGFVFAAAGIMIISRFVTLTFIMIFSPILFAATVFPKTEHYAGDLWKKLLSSAFYVPVYLLLTFIVLKMISTLHLSANLNWVDALANHKTNASASAVFLQFGIIIFFMIQTLLISSKFSIIGGDMITAKTKSLIGASTAGLAARAGRSTIGRLGNFISEKDGLKDAAGKGGPIGWGARMALKTSRVGADASFDARNTGVGKSLGMGSGRKGGWDSVKKEINEKEEKFAKSLGVVADDDFRVEVRKREAEKKKKDLAKEKEKLTAEKKELSALNTEIKKAAARGEYAAVKELQDDINDLRNSISQREEHLEHTEHEAHDAEVAHASEKQRRILGSTFDKPSDSATSDLIKYKANITKQKAELKNAWNTYLNETDEAKKEKLSNDIKTFKKDIKDEQDKHDTLLNASTKDRGYAGTLEKSRWYNSWPIGRLAVQNQDAGKTMRKARKDGLPKEKGGGGHDDHKDDDHGEKAHAAPVAHAPAHAAPAHAAPAAAAGHGPAAHH